MRILGIDPGLNVTGLGVIEVEDDHCVHLHHSVLRTKASDSLAARLSFLRDGVRDAAKHWLVSVGAVETSFVANNARSALMLGHARAAAIIGLADACIPVSEYAPNLIKQTVVGYGHSDKAQVALMVKLQLHLAAVPTPADAADALAIALTHWAHSRIERMV